VTWSADQVLFAHVVDRPESQLPLDVAGLLVGEWRYPELDVGHYLGVLDGFADQVATTRDNQEPVPFRGIRALNSVLFDKLGFRGNDDDYYDPRNSFLNEVIDRRVGIPIALAVIYIEVGRRAGITIGGVPFPGHFLVRYDEDDESLVLDPFQMGLSLDEDDLRARLVEHAGADAELVPGMLATASKRQILRRMLTNLSAIFRADGDVHSSIAVLERLCILAPTDVRLERELEQLRRRAGEMN